MGRGRGSTGTSTWRTNQGSASRDKTMRGYSSVLAKSIKAREDEIRGLGREHLSIFDENGNEVFRNIGSKTRVGTNPALEKDNIVTHNHPSMDTKGMQRPDNGGSFSRQDIIGSIQNDAKEIRAVTSTYTYSLKRPAGGWRSGGWKDGEFIGNDARVYKTTSQKVTKQLQSYVFNYKGDSKVAARRARSVYAHLISKEFAKTAGYEYTKQKVN